MSVLTFFESKTQLKATVFTLSKVLVVMLAFMSGNIVIGSQGVAFGVWLLSFKFVAGFVFLYMLYKANVLGLLNNWSFDKKQIIVILIWAVFFVPVILSYGFEIAAGRPALVILISHQSTGFFEEFQFRGALLLGLLFVYLKTDSQSPMMRAIIVSSLYFGGVHVFNILMGNPAEILVPTLLQVVSATIAGVGFCILVVVTRNIWIASVIHGIINSLQPELLYTFIPSGLTMIVLSAIITFLSLFVYKSTDINAFVNDFKDRVKM